MDKIEQLYKLYIEKGLITSETSLEDFANANKDIQGKLYELGKTEGLFVTTGLNDFQSAWAPAPAKTLDPADVDPTVVSLSDTGSGLVDGSLESQPIDITKKIISTLKGRKYDKDTDSYVESNEQNTVFGMKEEEGVAFLSGMFEGTGIEFEEGVIGRVSDLSISSIYQALEAVDVKLGGEMITLNFDTSDPDVVSKNVKDLESFISKNKKLINIDAWEKSKLASKNLTKKWVDGNVDVKKAENKYGTEILDNKDLFTDVEETYSMSGGVGLGGAVIRKTRIVSPYKEEIATAVKSLKEIHPDVSDNVIKENAKKVVRNQLYNSKITEAKYLARENFIKKSDDRDAAQASLYVGSLLLKEDEGKAFNTNSKKLQITTESLVELDSAEGTLFNVLNQGSSTEEQDTELKNIVVKYNIALDDKNTKRVKLKSGKEISENYFILATELNDAKKGVYADFKESSDKQQLNINNIEDISMSMDAASKNYDLIDKYSANIALGFSDIAVGIAYLGTKGAAEVLSLQPEQKKKIDAAAVRYSMATQDFRQSFSRDISFDSAFSSPSNFGSFVGQEISNQIPILVSMMATGGAASYVVGASSAGSKMMDMQTEIANGTAEYSDGEIWLKSAGFGITEGVFEGLTTVKALGRAKSRWINNSKDQVVDNSTKTFFREKYKGLIYEPLIEAGGEVLTTGSQNLIDGKPFTQDMAHAGFSGYGFGLLFSAVPFMKGMYNSKFSSYESLAKARALQGEISDITKQWNNATTDAAMISLEKQMADLSNQLADVVKKQQNIVDNNLTENAANGITEVTRLQLDLQNKANEIAETDGLTDDQKTSQINALKPRFDALQQIKEKALKDESMLKNETEFIAFEALNKESYDGFITEAANQLSDERHGKDAPIEDVKRRAYNLFFGDKVRTQNNKQSSSKGVFSGDFRSFETVADAIDYINNQQNLSPEVKEEAKKGLEGGNDGVAVREFDGRKRKTTIAVIENQVLNQKLNVRSHEVNHQAMWEIFKNPENDGAFKAISDQLLKTLKQVDSKLYDELIKSIGDEIDSPLEVVAKFTEKVAANKIAFNKSQKAKGIAGLFGVMIQKQFKGAYDFDFKGENDIFNFVVGLGQKISDGKLTIEDIKAAREGKLISGLIKNAEKVKSEEKTTVLASTAVKSIADLNAELEELIDNEYEIDEGDFESQKSNLEFKIKQALKKEKETPKKPTAKKEGPTREKISKEVRTDNLGPNDPRSKEIMDAYDKGMTSIERAKYTAKDPLPAALENKLLPLFKGYINTIVNQAFMQTKEEGFSKQDAIRVMEDNVLAAIRTFNPSVNKDLAGYVKKYGVQTRKSDMFKDVNKEYAEDLSAASDITSENTFYENNTESSGLKESTQKMIKATSFGPISDPAILEAVENVIEVKETERPNFKSLNNKYFDKVSEVIFGISGKKTRGNASLKYDKSGGSSEANSLQNVFKNDNDVRKFIKTMPDYNIATKETVINEQGEIIDVSRDTYGRSIGINPKVLAIFYDKVEGAIPGISSPNGRSLGQTTQTDVYKLKPEFTGNISPASVAKLQSLIGVNKGTLSIPIKGEARTEFGSILTGLTKMYIDNVINTVGRSKLDTNQAKADLGAGKSSLMFSKVSSSYNAITGLNTDMDFNDKSKVNKLKASIFNVLEGFNEEDFVKYIIPLASKGYNYKWKTIDGSAKLVEDSKNNRNVVFEGRFDFFKSYNNHRRSIGLKTIKYKSYDRAITYLDVKNIKRNTTLAVIKNQSVKGLNSGKFFETINERILIAKDQREGLKRILKALRKYNSENKTDTTFIPMVFAMMNSNTNGLIRTAALPKWIMYVEGLKDSDYVYEHSQTASDTLVELMKAVYNSKTDADFEAAFEKIMENFDIAIIPSDQNAIVNTTMKMNGPRESGKKSDYSSSLVYPAKNGLPIRYDQANKKLGANISLASITEFSKNNNLEKVLNLSKSKTKASKSNNNALPSSINYSKNKNITIQESIDALAKTDKALDNARKLDAPVKKIRVFDFDDTLAQTKSNVLYTMPDGTEGKIDAATFAKEAGNMEAEGAVWDFSEFSKVVDGKKGPLFEVAKIIADKRGTDDVFVLTARPANAAGPIKEFLASMGLDIPVGNITGLGDGAPQAKAGWIMGKAAEGYNDFYFADDHTGNVEAVKDVLSQIDVKSKVQLAKVKFSKNLDLDFNKIIENKTGIASYKEFAAVKAALRGQKKGRFYFFIPPSAEDFVGLLYYTLGKGKVGDAQMKWYKDNLLNPYARAIESITRDRNSLGRDFLALKKDLKIIPKNLKKKTKNSDFTREQAVRIYIWNQLGEDIPGLSKLDLVELVDIVNSDPQLKLFAQEVMKLNKGRAYTKPTNGWVAGTITTDLLESLNTTGRKDYLSQWQQNVDVIFSEKNLNKMEAAYGKSYRVAMENILHRMETGRNRNFGVDTLTGRFTDWINASTAGIMFFNTRSAVLQTISAINFINFSDNNVLAAGKAFANQPQYWSDFKKLFNSDFLTQRRDGLKIDINESDIADIARENGVRGVIGRLLKLGFLPTQIADSFAIASGGATFYRNRIKSLVKGGMDPIAAEKQAMRDFRETAEESQQSSRPDKISQQQAGSLGRIVLAFANTPAQYARLMKKAASDLKNGRGDAKTNLSKILYYGVAQNLLFNALQQALFAISFGDDDDEELENKAINIANGMVDSVARGTGLYGAAFSVVKNASIKLYKQTQEKNPKYEDIALELLKISPPISSKIQKIRSAGRSASWEMESMKTKGFSLDNPAYLAAGNVVSSVFNIPLDRVIKKVENLKNASDSEIETYKRIALLAGWADWELGIDSKPKEKKKKSNSKKARTTSRTTSRTSTRN